jgi:hypothetical protein
MFYLCSHLEHQTQVNVPDHHPPGHHPPDRSPPNRHQPIPRDEPFLEALFGVLCRDLFVLPGETFVDQAQRWTDALGFVASLGPRDQPEWLQAADVTMKHFAAVHSLLMRKRQDVPRHRRVQHSQDFLVRAKAMQDARLRYELLRHSRIS